MTTHSTTSTIGTRMPSSPPPKLRRPRTSFSGFANTSDRRHRLWQICRQRWLLCHRLRPVVRLACPRIARRATLRLYHQHPFANQSLLVRIAPCRLQNPSFRHSPHPSQRSAPAALPSRHPPNPDRQRRLRSLRRNLSPCSSRRRLRPSARRSLRRSQRARRLFR